MVDSGRDNASTDSRPEKTHAKPGLLDLVEDGANKALTSIKATTQNAERAIHDNPIKAAAALGGLAVGVAGAVYLHKKEVAEKVGLSLLKGEALDAKALDMPSIFAKSEKSTGFNALTKMRGNDILKPSETHLDLSAEIGTTAKPSQTTSDLLAGLDHETPVESAVPEIGSSEGAPLTVEKANFSPAHEVDDFPPPSPRKEFGDIRPRSEEELKTFAESINKFDRMEAAYQPNTPRESLIKLASDPDPDVKVNLVLNKNAPFEAIDIAAKDPEIRTRTNAANSPNLSAESAVKLGEDQDPHIRQLAYKNLNMPTERLVEGSRSSDWRIVDGVAENPKTPPETLQEMAAASKSLDLHYKIRTNPNTPAEVKDVLKAEADRYFDSWNKVTPPDKLASMVKAPEIETRLNLTRNPNTPSETMRILANDHELAVRRAAFKSANVPVDELVKASKDNDDVTRWNVALNRKTPTETLREMASNESFTTRRFVQRNPETPADVREALKLRDGYAGTDGIN